VKSRSSHINFLFEKAKNNDSKAVNELFEYLNVSFRLFLQSRSIEKQDSEDILQSVMLTISAKYRDLVSSHNFSGWAYAVLKNKLYDFYKSKRSSKIQNVGKRNFAEEFSAATSNPLLLMQLKQCLSKISEKNLRYMRILNLCYLGHSKEEICNKLKITPNNFYVILSRARAMLKKCLEREDIIK
jgi:RNA polymerase sigma-70 factor (ECF subfamily)